MSQYDEMAASRASSDVIELFYGTIPERGSAAVIADPQTFKISQKAAAKRSGPTKLKVHLYFF